MAGHFCIVVGITEPIQGAVEPGWHDLLSDELEERLYTVIFAVAVVEPSSTLVEGLVIFQLMTNE